MFPNPQDALPLPPHPNCEQYKKLAKDLLRASKGGHAEEIRTWSSHWIEKLTQLGAFEEKQSMGADRWITEISLFAKKQLQDSNPSLANAQFVIARCHGFESWRKFAKHIENLSRENSSLSDFESAADAIVKGDENHLRDLIRKDPGLVRARSTREHSATLLHYVSANGVENFRQKTPGNIVTIANLLLGAGAEVNAEANVYGGGATTLGLVATSVHPERAGVQEALMDLLLGHGADINHGSERGHGSSIVRDCLANGRKFAAEFLAGRGARLDLEAASGLGRIEMVKRFFTSDGALTSSATRPEMERGFLWACEYGRDEVIDFLLNNGVDINARADTGQTGLHWAIIGGQLETTQLLLTRGASLKVKNSYDATPIGQALWSVVNAEDSVNHLGMIKALLVAGAEVPKDSLSWLKEQSAGSPPLKEQVAQLLRDFGAAT
jgi:hypothetical protein